MVTYYNPKMVRSSEVYQNDWKAFLAAMLTVTSKNIYTTKQLCIGVYCLFITTCARLSISLLRCGGDGRFFVGALQSHHLHLAAKLEIFHAIIIHSQPLIWRLPSSSAF